LACTKGIRYTLGGKRIEEKTNVGNGTEARKILNERLGDVAKGIPPAAASKVRFAELYTDMQADYRNKGSDLGVLAKRWKHLEPVFGTDPVATITSARMQRYVDVRRDTEKAAPATVQLEIAALRRMLRLGYENRKVGQLPAFPTIAIQNVRTGFFEQADFERVCAELPTYLRPLVTVAYWLGWRLGELLSLQWRHVDLERGTVSLDAGTTKNDDGRLAYLPAEALAALADWRERTTVIEHERSIIVPTVFHPDGLPIRDLYTAWNGACERAGVAGRLFHDFRRTAARNYRRQGVSEGVVMAVLGHKTRSMFERYNIKNEDDLREAAAMVSQKRIGKDWEGLGKKGKNPPSQRLQATIECPLATRHHCRGRESNPHRERTPEGILSPLRLPFRHPGIAATSHIYKQTQIPRAQGLSADFLPFRLFRSTFTHDFTHNGEVGRAMPRDVETESVVTRTASLYSQG
jgi:integrase